MKAILTTKGRWHLLNSNTSMRIGKLETLCGKHILPQTMIEYEGQKLNNLCFSCALRLKERGVNW